MAFFQIFYTKYWYIKKDRRRDPPVFCKKADVKSEACRCELIAVDTAVLVELHDETCALIAGTVCRKVCRSTNSGNAHTFAERVSLEGEHCREMTLSAESGITLTDCNSLIDPNVKTIFFENEAGSTDDAQNFTLRSFVFGNSEKII